MIAFFVGMGAIAWALDAHPYVALGVIGLLVLIVGFFLIGTWRFADKHPDQAAMGDSVWLKFREFQMGTKSQPILVPLPAQSDPVAPSFFKVDQPNLSHQDDLDGDG
jgi:hypothetical protein